MFEITYHDGESLKEWIDRKKVYADAVYDFTFENRFIVYHCFLLKKAIYIALDKTTGYGSEILCREPDDLYTPSEYRTMIYPILRSVKYTGDSRYLGVAYICPNDLIDVIFRDILPNCGYSIREEQISLCKEMYKGLTEKNVSLCEAEVGTGKTFAYLVASLIANQNWHFRYDTHWPVTITTSSIELQNALMTKEIPALSSALLRFGIIKKPLTAVLRKGKEHYFCQFRYEDYKKKIQSIPVKYAPVLRQLEAFNFSRAFDLDGSNLSPRICSRICVKGSCYKCKYEKSCKCRALLHRTARNSDIDFQITNHNLYQTYMKLRADNKSMLLSPSQYIIVDEAHKFRETAQAVFGTSFSEKDIPKYLNYAKNLYAAKTNPKTYWELLQTTALLNQALFEKLKQVYPLNPDEDEHSRSVDLTGEDIFLIKRLINGMESIESRKRNRNGSIEVQATAITEALQTFLVYGRNNVWVESDENEIYSLCSSPKKISDILSKTIWKADVSHVLTSGTMSDGMDFSFFRRENGLDQLPERKILTSAQASPFDYKNYARLYIPSGMPQPDNDDPEYIQAVADQIVRLTEATNGHTAILFTSYKLLSAVYEMTKDKLSAYQVICMTRSNKNAIRDFQKSKNSVLFASGAFWEGVDCSGDRLSSVIIVRLPFPIRSANLEQTKNKCPDVQTFIKKYAVPEMLIKLRQGVGRLIRCESDTGLISILDARAEHGTYASKVRQVLHEYPEVKTPEEVQAFFKAVKPKEYFEESTNI